MRWYKILKASMVKGASMDVRVTDYIPPKHAKDILSLSYFLITPVYDVIKALLPPSEFKKWDESKNPEFITSDGNDYDKQKGVMNFYANGLSGLVLRKAIGAIGYYAKEFGAEIGQPTLESFQAKNDALIRSGTPASEIIKDKDPDAIRVVRFPVRIKPLPQGIEIPPELNLANGNMAFIMQDVLNYPSEDYWVINAAELLTKIGHASNFVKQKALEETNKERTEQSTPNYHVSTLEPEYIERVLNKMAEIARWALKHDYMTISIG